MERISEFADFSINVSLRTDITLVQLVGKYEVEFLGQIERHLETALACSRYELVGETLIDLTQLKEINAAGFKEIIGWMERVQRAGGIIALATRKGTVPCRIVELLSRQNIQFPTLIFN